MKIIKIIKFEMILGMKLKRLGYLISISFTSIETLTEIKIEDLSLSFDSIILS